MTDVTFLFRDEDGSAVGVQLDPANPGVIAFAWRLVESLRGTPQDSRNVVRWTAMLEASRLGAVRAAIGLDALSALRGDPSAQERCDAVDMDAEIDAYQRYKASVCERL